MSLADHLAAPPRLPTQALQCKTCIWYRAQTPEEKALFDDWVAQGGSIRKLHRSCVAEGLSVAHSGFENHIKDHHLNGFADVTS